MAIAFPSYLWDDGRMETLSKAIKSLPKAKVAEDMGAMAGLRHAALLHGDVPGKLHAGSSQ